MSISELAQLNGVSDATVFKFTKLIGYEGGYMDFTKDVQKKPPQQTPNISRNQTHRQDVLPRKDNGKRDQKKLESFSASLSEEDIDKCVDKLVKADYISVVGGLMTASPIGQVYSHVLMQLFPDVTNISNLDVYAYSALNRLTDKSVAIIISFPRFSMVLDDLAKSMKKKKVFQLGITNSGDSPLLRNTRIYS